MRNGSSVLAVLCLAGCSGAPPNAGGEGEGEGDVAGEGEGEDEAVGEGEGDVVGEGEGEVVGGVSVFVQLTWVGDPDDGVSLFGVARDDRGLFCVDEARASDAPLTACASQPLLVVGPGGPLTAEWGAAGAEQDPRIDAPGALTLSVDAGDGGYVFGADVAGEPRSVFLRLFVGGQLRAEWVETLSSGSFVFFALDVAEADACVEDLRDGELNDDCP